VARCRSAAELRLLVSWDAEALPADGGSLVERARAIPGALVASDLGAREARRFGASASGQVLLYDAAGLLLFEGGITAARGHAGDNAGEDALVAALRTGIRQEQPAPVFGCPLLTGRRPDASPLPPSAEGAVR
jgi:hypothetical protein